MKYLKQLMYQFLRRSESFFKTDMVYVARGGFWFSAAQVVVSLSSFALAIAFAHFVTKEAYGQYKYILSVAGLLGTLTLTGLPSTVLRATAKGFEGTLVYAFWKNIQWSAFFFIICFSLSGYYFYQGNSLLGTSLLVVGSFWPFFQSTNLYNSYLIAKKDFKRNALYFDILGNLIPAASVLVCMVLTNNPVWLVTVYLGANTLIGLILYKRVVRIYKPNHLVDQGALGYSKHLSLMSILSGVAANLDQVLVFQHIGSAELAIYNFALAIPNQAKGPLKGLSGLIFPKFVEREDHEIHKGMGHKYMVMFLLGLSLTVGYILAAPYIFKLFFPAYMDSIIYSQIFALSFLSITFNPAEIYFAAKKKIRQQYIATTANSIIQIVVISVAIANWGLMGLVIARVVLRFVANWIYAILYWQTARTHVHA